MRRRQEGEIARSGQMARAVGRDAEQLAVGFLKARGYRVRETNVRFRDGEIDIVAEDGETLVFVEVRARRPGPYGTAAESIGTAKRTRIYRAAERYLQEREPECMRPARIDAVLITLDGSGRAREIQLIPNALEQPS